MAFEIRVPRLGWTMETGTFAGWLKKDGEAVQEGAPIFSIESDKALQEVESVASGILRIPPDSPAPGTELAVGALLGYVVAPGEVPPFESDAAVVSAAAPAGDIRAGAAAGGMAAAAVPGGVRAVATKGTAAAGGMRPLPPISPRARRIAGVLGVDWTSLRGSGRTGRIVERDVREASRSGTTSARRSVPLDAMRRTIAERMHAGTSAAAPVTMTTEVDATELVLLKERLRKSQAARGEPAPTFTDLFVLLVAKALTVHPRLNARFERGEIVLDEAVHVAVAVDTPDGLLAPVIRDVQRKDLWSIARETSALIEKARLRKLAAEEMQGGTFTLSNIGMYRVDAFTPILNLPQCAILGVGRIVWKPAVREGQVVPRQVVTLSLTFDHRVVDGAPAARFLTTVSEYVEQPGLFSVSSQEGRGHL